MTPPMPDSQPSRREFIRIGAAAVGALAIGSAVAEDAATQPALSSAPAATLAPGVIPWWIERYPERSRVVDTYSPRLLRGTTVDPFFLQQTVNSAVMTLTGAADPDAAWRRILGDAERIVLKFNSVGAEALRINDPLAVAIVRELREAGYDPGKIALVEASPHLRTELETAEVPQGWSGRIRFGEHEEELAAYVTWADAIIDVPLLKTHQIAGMSCCLKNLSHAVIRRPALYHADSCSPFVAQIVSQEELRDRLKLCLVNAMRMVIDRGPDARPEDIVLSSRLLAGFDPVAVDSVGLSLLSSERRARGLASEIPVPYLVAADQLGLGRAASAQIERLSQVLNS